MEIVREVLWISHIINNVEISIIIRCLVNALILSSPVCDNTYNRDFWTEFGVQPLYKTNLARWKSMLYIAQNALEEHLNWYHSQNTIGCFLYFQNAWSLTPFTVSYKHCPHPNNTCLRRLHTWLALWNCFFSPATDIFEKRMTLHPWTKGVVKHWLKHGKSAI